MAQFFTHRHKFAAFNSLFFPFILLQLAKTLIIRRFLITKLRALPLSLTHTSISISTPFLSFSFLSSHWQLSSQPNDLVLTCYLHSRADVA